MKNMKPKDILLPTIALFVICLVSSVLLAVTNSSTVDKIAEQNAKTVQESLNAVVTEVDGVAVDSFSDAKTANDLEYYEALDADSNVIAYVFSSASKGYGGDVQVMTAYDTTGNIIGFTVVDCSDETPGLGQNSKTHFTSDFFNGKTASDTLAVVKDGGDVQAITAATITSRAVVNAVNEANEAVLTLINGTAADSTQEGGEE